MKVPNQSMQDAVFHLNVGSTSELARVLYPQMSQKLASFLWPQVSDTPAERAQELEGKLSNPCLPANLADDGKSMRLHP